MQGPSRQCPRTTAGVVAWRDSARVDEPTGLPDFPISDIDTQTNDGGSGAMHAIWRWRDSAQEETSLVCVCKILFVRAVGGEDAEGNSHERIGY